MRAWFGFPSEFSECCFRTPRHPNRCLDFYYRHRTPARPDGSTAGGDAEIEQTLPMIAATQAGTENGR